MVQQIMPEQVTAFWEAAKDTILKSIPTIHGESEQKMNNILAALLSGKMILWVTYEIDKMKKRTNGLFITRILEDDITEIKSLLMYCGHTYHPVSDQVWVEGWEAMEKYSKANGCWRMVVYTDVPALVERAKQFGGSTSYTFLSLPFSGG